MVRAILNKDEIVKLTMKPDLGTEIGTLSAADLHRFRWDGEKLVDITKAESIHVELGTFKLHVIPLPNTQEVTMNYTDRRILKNDSGTIRVKTEVEIEVEKALDYQRKREAEYPNLSAQIGVIMKYFSASGVYPTLSDEFKVLLRDIDVVKDKFSKSNNPDIPSGIGLGLKPH